jgi:DNA-binding transcriptional LysR family regulator
MELRILNYFLMVAREENITKAAQLLHVTQPTLSRQLIQLEEELGVKLFKRSNHNIILTDDGMLLKRRAQEIISLAQKTKREFVQEEQLSGEIAIGSGELQSTQFLSQLIASFREKYPLIQYEIYSGNSDNIKERIERGTLDLGLLLEPVDIRKYEFVRMPVKDEWGILAREDSELASKETVSPKDLIGMPLIVTRRELIQNELMNWFGTYSDSMEIVASGNLLYNLAIMARNKIGVAINLKLDCKYDGLCFVPLSPRLESSTVLAWKKAQTFSPATEAFIKHIKECLSDISGY